MKKFIAITFMALIASASFAQDATTVKTKAKKAKKAKTTAAVTGSVKAAPTASGWGSPSAAAPAAPVKAAVTAAPAAAAPVKAAPPVVAAAAPVKTSKAKMEFATDIMDYGTIKKGSERVRHFTFKNTGTEPLIISNATGSCGCTVPTYPKEPIMPGASASIDVNYDTQREGPFTKTVTLTTNAEGQESKLLTIKGTVEPAAPASGVTAPATGGH
jgi:Protein of unknown function (DUF1573)